MKRKTEETNGAPVASKKQATYANNVHSHFRSGLFDPEIVSKYSNQYATSGPYKHAVVRELINDELLRSVRSEIVRNIHFTPKETDIYKIHQSGDLANLDGLPASALEKLPSLLRLRDALYSHDFRQWVSSVSGAGALSGKKTDMAVNVYVPGCHLLCHDDVIGSRRVSYILYLTDPDKPWQSGWGGALRLYPTEQLQGGGGREILLPKAEWTKVIPPAWNQLSFFAVQPGESFHDVEEVYHRSTASDEDDGGRVRMAISGWFHIPQEGEDGFEPGLEEKLAEKSSLQQLQGKADDFDLPQHQWISPISQEANSSTGESPEDLTESDLQFLIKFMNPTYLTPDTVEELNELFTEESVLQLTNFLSEKFFATLKSSFDVEVPEHPFATSRPPYKHRYQYMPSKLGFGNGEDYPFRQVLNVFLPSLAFHKWLTLVTSLPLSRTSILARRFRRGLDYQLAQGYSGDEPQLEYTLCVTPTTGWSSGEDQGEERAPTNENGNGNGNGEEDDNPGGYELYMAGDEDNDNDGDSDDGVTIPASVQTQSQTGAGRRRAAKDPAIYQAAGEDEDDGILFSNPASWNTMSIVLRDKGTLKFVKYVSASAPGDRYDFTGCVEVMPGDDDDGDEESERSE